MNDINYKSQYLQVNNSHRFCAGHLEPYLKKISHTFRVTQRIGTKNMSQLTRSAISL